MKCRREGEYERVQIVEEELWKSKNENAGMGTKRGRLRWRLSERGRMGKRAGERENKTEFCNSIKI